jgi:hypothetical protein
MKNKTKVLIYFFILKNFQMNFSLLQIIEALIKFLLKLDNKIDICNIKRRSIKR